MTNRQCELKEPKALEASDTEAQRDHNNDHPMELGDDLYDRFGKPLESEHWGKFVAISPKGETLLGTDMDEVFLRALDETGRGFFLFKVGEK